MANERESEARLALRRAMALQAEERIDEALAEARRAVALDPASAEARSYLGSTLVTRKRGFREGLAELERARDLAPGDPWVRFTLGWCYELIAHDWPAARPMPEGVPPVAELYRRAIAEFYAALEAGADAGLADDIKKLLDRLGEHVDD